MCELCIANAWATEISQDLYKLEALAARENKPASTTAFVRLLESNVFSFFANFLILDLAMLVYIIIGSSGGQYLRSTDEAVKEATFKSWGEGIDYLRIRLTLHQHEVEQPRLLTFSFIVLSKSNINFLNT